MYAAKTSLWSEILRSFTTVRAAGRTPAPGMAARAVREAAVDHQRAEQLLENPELAWWARRKARRALAEAGHRFDKALLAWESTGQPYATRLEAQRERLGAETALLEQARASREEFFADHPEVPSRLAELDRAIAREQENERRRSWELLKEREHARHLGISHELDQWLRHRTVTPVRTAGRETGALVTPVQHRSRNGLGAISPPGRGAAQQCPVALVHPSSR